MLDPAPVGAGLQQHPDRPTQCARKVRDHRIDGDDEIELEHRGGGELDGLRVPRIRFDAERRVRVVRGAAALLHALPAQVWAQAAWNPGQTVTVVVPYPAGGPTDSLARLVGQEMAKELGQQVIVENVPGGAGAIGSRRVAQGPADGHVLLATTNQTHATNISLLADGGGYHPVNDFAPIALLADLQHILVVKNDLPVQNFADFLKLAKAQPGKLNCGSTGPGSASHLALELFKAKAGTDLTHVPYKGSAPLLQDLLGGHVDCSFATTPICQGMTR